MFLSLTACTEGGDEGQRNFQDYPDGTWRNMRKYEENLKEYVENMKKYMGSMKEYAENIKKHEENMKK